MRRYRAHYDVIVMIMQVIYIFFICGLEQNDFIDILQVTSQLLMTHDDCLPVSKATLKNMGRCIVRT